MKKGFTLIELLVVIAIVGILAGITIAVLSNTKEKARDSELKGLMDQMRKQAEIYYSINGNYGASFQDYCYRAIGSGNGVPGNQVPNPSLNIFGPNVDEGLYKLVVAATVLMDNPWNNNPGSAADLACRSNGQAWGVRMPLPSNNGNWCVDSTGHAGPSTSMQGPRCYTP